MGGGCGLVVQVSWEMGEAPDKKRDRLLRTSSPEPHMSSSYPVPAAAGPVRAGMMVAVPLELVASPLKSGRDLGEAQRHALVVGAGDPSRDRARELRVEWQPACE